MSEDTPAAPMFFIGWTQPDGRRDWAKPALSKDAADRLVERFNAEFSDVAEYFAAPMEKLESWKDASWTP